MNQDTQCLETVDRPPRWWPGPYTGSSVSQAGVVLLVDYVDRTKNENLGGSRF